MNHLKAGNEATPTAPRHGAHGTVQLTTAISPELKSELVKLCRSRGSTLRNEIIEALELHVARARMTP